MTPIGDGLIKLELTHLIVTMVTNGMISYVLILKHVLRIVLLMELVKNKIVALIMLSLLVMNLSLDLLLKDNIQKMLDQELT